MRVALLLLLAAVAGAGCTDMLADELAEDRREALERERAEQESTAPPTHEPTTPAEGAWPRAGSFVRYEVRGGEGDGTSFGARVEWTHDGRAWSGTCRGARTADGETAAFEGTVDGAPPRVEATPARGEAVRVRAPAACEPVALDLLAQGVFPEDVTVDGAPARVQAWWADEGAAREPTRDEDAWWHAGTGLLLRWESATHATDAGFGGRLIDTDAPLG